MSALLTETRRLIVNRPRDVTYKVIQRDTKGEISVKWLEYFMGGRIKNPPVHKIECLFDYLNGKSLSDILADR